LVDLKRLKLSLIICRMFSLEMHAFAFLMAL